MISNSYKAVFGRHETFPLRYSWLTKGFRAFMQNPNIFSSNDATVTLGVGKNMVSAIRYWMQATRILQRTPQGLVTTEIGQLIFSETGYDPYLEDEATLWLLHWLLSLNYELATTWYWFFNKFHKPEFTGQEVSNSLIDFVKGNTHGKLSTTRVKNDVLVMLRMYSQSTGSGRTSLEEALDSPLALLRLVTKNSVGGVYQSIPAARDSLPIGVIGFALAQIFNTNNQKQLPLEALMYGTSSIPALGAVFRLTESGLLTKLENLVQKFSEKFNIRDQGGIHQLYLLDEIQPFQFLQYHYVDQGGGEAE